MYLLILKWLYFIKCTYVIKWNCTLIFKWFILEGINHVPWSCKGKIRSWPLDLGWGRWKDTFEGKCHFHIYKKMHWVVCKTCWEDIGRRVKEIFWVSLREESEQQRGHIFQGRRAQIQRKFYVIFWAKLIFYCGRS